MKKQEVVILGCLAVLVVLMLGGLAMVVPTHLAISEPMPTLIVLSASTNTAETVASSARVGQAEQPAINAETVASSVSDATIMQNTANTQANTGSVVTSNTSNLTQDTASSVPPTSDVVANNTGQTNTLTTLAQPNNTVFSANNTNSGGLQVLNISNQNSNPNSSVVVNNNPNTASVNNNSTAPIIPVELDKPITNQLTVTFDDTATPADREAYLAQVQQMGGKIVMQIDALNSVVIEVLPSMQLPASALVSSEPDYYVSIAEAISAPSDVYFDKQWAFQAIPSMMQAQSALPNNPITVKVGIIDSGACENHPDMPTASGINLLNSGASIRDQFNHGCGVSSIIGAISNNGIGMVGVAPNAQMTHYVVLDNKGVGSVSSVAQAIVNAVDNGEQILNVSLGSLQSTNLLENAVRYAKDHNVVIIAAAGNTRTTTIMYPAALTTVYPQHVIAVGSINQDLSRSVFSSSHTAIGLYAPGNEIFVASNDGNYRTVSGTSFATPYVTGMAVLQMALGQGLVVNGGIVAVHFDTIIATPLPTDEPTLPPVANPSLIIDSKVLDALQANGTAKVFINLVEPAMASSDEVVYAQAIAQAQSDVLALMDAADFTTKYQYATLPAIAGTINQDGLEQLKQSQAVMSVTLDEVITAHAMPAPLSGLELVGASDALALNATGEGIVVAIGDTAIDTTHPYLTDSILQNWCNRIPNAAETHGTHVAGIITAPGGIAPDAKLVVDCTLNADGGGNMSDVTNFLQKIINQPATGVKVVNLSIGTDSEYASHCDTQYPPLFTAVKKLRDKGILVVAASGNNGNAYMINAPACITGVVPVMATYPSTSVQEPVGLTYTDIFGSSLNNNCVTDSNITPDTLACFSNNSWKPSLAAPGAGIVSSVPGNQVEKLYGTSMASPYVVGVIADMLQKNPYLLPIQIEEILFNTGQPVVDTRVTNTAINPNTRVPRVQVTQAIQTAINSASNAFSCAIANQQSGINLADCHALVTFYSNANGNNWNAEARQNWLKSAFICPSGASTHWQGVTCSNGRVTGINLPSANIIGTVESFGLENLSALTSLNLRSNGISGNLGNRLNSLANLVLTGVSLDYNLLQGTQFIHPSKQTTPPRNANAVQISPTTFVVLWSRSLNSSTGNYSVVCRPSNGDAILQQATTDKNITQLTFTGVIGVSYDCQVSEVTNADTTPIKNYPNPLTSLAASIATLEVKANFQTVGLTQSFNALTAGFIHDIGSNSTFRGMCIGTYRNPTFTENYPNCYSVVTFGQSLLPNANVTSCSIVLWAFGSQPFENANVEVRLDSRNGTKIAETIFPPYNADTSVDPTVRPQRREISIPAENCNALKNDRNIFFTSPTAGVFVCSGNNIDGYCTATMKPSINFVYDLTNLPEGAYEPTPTHNSVDVRADVSSNNITLKWNFKPDADGTSVAFKVYRDNVLLADNVPQTQTTVTIPYTANTRVSWRVDIVDADGRIQAGNTWEFSTNVCGIYTAEKLAECNQLHDFFYASGGNNSSKWTNETSWRQVADYCTWYGITCDTNGRVIGLQLPSNQLDGSLPANFFGNLSLLKTLDLSDNKIGGLLPERLTNSALENLNLSDNVLNTTLPNSWGGFINLKNFNLSQNGLTGVVPSSWSAFTQLQVFNVKGNHLGASGNNFIELPDMSAWTQLQTLDISENRFSKLPLITSPVISLDAQYNRISAIPTTYDALFDTLTSAKIGNNMVNQASLSSVLQAGLLALDATNFSTQSVAPIYVGATNIFDNGFDLNYTPTSYPNIAKTSLYCNQRIEVGASTFITSQPVPNNQIEARKLYSNSSYDCKLVTEVQASGKQQSTLQVESNLFTVQTTNNNSADINTFPTSRSFNTTGMPTDAVSACGTNGIGRNGAKSVGIKGGSASIIRVEVESVMVNNGGLLNNAGQVAATIVENDANGNPIKSSCNTNSDKQEFPATTAQVQAQADYIYHYASLDYIVNPGSTYELSIVVLGEGDITVYYTVSDISFRGCNQQTSVPVVQCQALQDVYAQTNGASWLRKDNWMLHADVCTWYGVTCENGNVVELSLPANQLVGSLPTSLSNLNLRKFNISYNSLAGQIPNISAWGNTAQIDVSHNMLTTTEPTLSYLNQVSPLWQGSQNVAPVIQNATLVTGDTVQLMWSLPGNAWTMGYYEVGVASQSGGPYTYMRVPGDKTVQSFTMSITPNANAYFVIRNITETYDLHTQTMTSDNSAEYTFVNNCTAPNPARDIEGSMADYAYANSGTITNKSRTCSYLVGIASYKLFNDVLEHQELFDWKQVNIAPDQTITLEVSIPTCASQVDLFYGEVLHNFLTQRYSYNPNRRLDSRHPNDNYCKLVTNDSYSVNEGATLQTDATNGVLVNDNSNYLVSVNRVTAQPANGSLTLNANGTFTYVHNGSETLTDSFRYRACHQYGYCAVARVNITIVPTNDAPSAVADMATLDQDTFITIPVSANDTDADTPVLFVSAFTQASNGTVSDVGNGALMYTPKAGYFGLDSFTYTISDGVLTSTTAVTVTIVMVATPIPTEMVTEQPTDVPTQVPTELPTEMVTEQPTDVPTEVPTEQATEIPTQVPTEVPTDMVTEQPTEVTP
jgi:thermitase